MTIVKRNIIEIRKVKANTFKYLDHIFHIKILLDF